MYDTMSRDELLALVKEKDKEILELREMAEMAQEIGVREGLFDAEEAVLPWQDYDSTVARLEAL